jgi:hypothetical protein
MNNATKAPETINLTASISPAVNITPVRRTRLSFIEPYEDFIDARPSTVTEPPSVISEDRTVSPSISPVKPLNIRKRTASPVWAERFRQLSEEILDALPASDMGSEAGSIPPPRLLPTPPFLTRSNPLGKLRMSDIRGYDQICNGLDETQGPEDLLNRLKWQVQVGDDDLDESVTVQVEAFD